MTLRRWLALSGVGAALLFAVAFFSGGGTPNDDASAAKVVKYFQDHRVATQVEALLGVIGAVLLVLLAIRFASSSEAMGRMVACCRTLHLAGQ